MTKKPAQVVPQVVAPQIKANITTKEKPKKTGKLGFASNKKKDPEPAPQPLPSPVIEAPQQDADMSDGDRKASVEDLSQDMDNMEIKRGARKSKKRRLVQNDSEDELEVSEKMELSDTKKGEIGGYFQKSSAEQS